MMTVVEAMRVPVQLDDQLTMTAMRNIGAYFFESRFDDAGINIIADRMREKSMQGGAMLVIHTMISARSVLMSQQSGAAPVRRRCVQLSLAL
jgi:hypothetical protein